MAWNPPDPEEPQPTLCDEMRGDCGRCPERIPCSMPEPPELDLDDPAVIGPAMEEVRMDEPTGINRDDLSALAKQATWLALRREHRDWLKSELARAQAAFEEANRDLIEQAREWTEKVAADERMIRESWGERLQAEPVPGFTVYTEKVLEYDAETAVQWCAMHGYHGLLRVDPRSFEKVALQLGLVFVKVTERPRVRIARDLSDLIPEAERLPSTVEVSDGDDDAATDGGDGGQLGV